VTCHHTEERLQCDAPLRLYLENKGSLFPCSEVEFYEFLCSEQASNAPQSRLKGYMQSMNFVLHVMSAHEVEPLTKSARCKGACLGEFIKERIQASPLRVCELRRIHELFTHVKTYGYVCFAVHCSWQHTAEPGGETSCVLRV
jgi:hypothetical protein